MIAIVELDIKKFNKKVKDNYYKQFDVVGATLNKDKKTYYQLIKNDVNNNIGNIYKYYYDPQSKVGNDGWIGEYYSKIILSKIKENEYKASQRIRNEYNNQKIILRENNIIKLEDEAAIVKFLSSIHEKPQAVDQNIDIKEPALGKELPKGLTNSIDTQNTYQEQGQKNNLKELRHFLSERVIGTYNPNSVDFDTKTNPPLLLSAEILKYYCDYFAFSKNDDYQVYINQYAEYLMHCIQNSENKSINSIIKTENYIFELHEKGIEYINLVEFVFYHTFINKDNDISLEEFLKNHNVIIDLINFLTKKDNSISNGFMEAFFKIAQEQKQEDVLNQYEEMFRTKFPKAFKSYDEPVGTKNPSLYTPQGKFISAYNQAYGSFNRTFTDDKGKRRKKFPGAFENNKSFYIVLILIILILIIIVTLAIIKILRKSKKKPSTSNKTRL